MEKIAQREVRSFLAGLIEQRRLVANAIVAVDEGGIVDCGVLSDKLERPRIRSDILDLLLRIVDRKTRDSRRCLKGEEWRAVFLVTSGGRKDNGSLRRLAVDGRVRYSLNGAPRRNR